MKRNKIINKLRNLILKTITYIAVAVWCISGSCVDSENPVLPVIALVISTVWIYAYCYANGYTYEKEDEWNE